MKTENGIELPDLNMDYTKLYDEKGMGVIPAMIFEDITNWPLVEGFMNRQAFVKSRETGLVTFWSRERQTLWTKGETSGNFLIIQRWIPDCDNDTLLVWVKPQGPVCHTGEDTCFGPKETFEAGMVPILTAAIQVGRELEGIKKFGYPTDKLNSAVDILKPFSKALMAAVEPNQEKQWVIELLQRDPQ